MGHSVREGVWRGSEGDREGGMEGESLGGGGVG